MDSDEYEFEGDSDIFSSDGEPAVSPATTKYKTIIMGWSDRNPQAKLRFIREEDECVVVNLWSAELQVYIPQDSESDFFVTTDDESSKVNFAVTELNGMPQIRALQDFLDAASRLLAKPTANGAKAQPVREEELACRPGLSRSKSAVVLSLERLREMQEGLIRRVSEAVGVKRQVSELLLLHTGWDEEPILKSPKTVLQEAGAALPPDEKPKPEPQLCSVCFVDHAVSCLPCGHGLCEDDWPAFLKCNLQSGTVGGENCLRLKCPGERCQMMVPSGYFQKYLDEEDNNRYRQLQVLSFVNDNPRIVWCPAQGCELAVGFSKRKSTVKCDCGHSFCFSCKQPAHAPAKCSSAKAWLEKTEKMKELAPAESCPTVKPCPNPNCGVPSHKESGCMYLTCPSCKEHWCWQCGDWGGGPSRRPEPHHVFDCNNPINQEWARKPSEIFSNEGRFWFYHQRYANHLDSLGFAEALREQLPDQAWDGLEMNPEEICRDYSSVARYDAIGTGAARSMLDSQQAWSPAANRNEEWMQMDLGAIQSVIGIIIQGRKDEGGEAWVTELEIQYGMKERRPDGTLGVFSGNNDGDTKMKVYFEHPVSARYIRLRPLKSHGDISMRAGVLVIDEARGEQGDDDLDLDLQDVKRKQEARQLCFDASSLLVDCRLVLAWTYVHAFFEADEKRRVLFEYIQKDLEKRTEQLSADIENQPIRIILQQRLQLIDTVAALRGYMENIKEYACVDPDAEVPAL